jgi:hypothetical protein
VTPDTESLDLKLTAAAVRDLEEMIHHPALSSWKQLEIIIFELKEKLHMEKDKAVTIQRRPTADKFPQDFLLESPSDISANLIKGPYDSKDQYLATHRRLLSEDFLRPLRQGLLDFQNGTKNPDDVYTYGRVTVSYRTASPKGDVEIDLDLEGREFNFSNVDWESSQKLTFGSLVVLLTRQNLFILGTVAQRDPEELAKGRVCVTLCDSRDFDKVRAGENFSMLESKAYFEAYRQGFQESF